MPVVVSSNGSPVVAPDESTIVAEVRATMTFVQQSSEQIRMTEHLTRIETAVGEVVELCRKRTLPKGERL